MISKLGRHFERKRQLLIAIAVLTFTYTSTSLFLFLRQRHLIYRPKSELSLLPNSPHFKLPYQEVWIPIADSQDLIHGWWIPSPSPQEQFSVISDEPTQILKSPKVMLYFCGVGRNMGDYNYLARVSAFRQLGFSVLMFDYRGYGRSQGNFPNESQLYEDSQATWNYLRHVRNIPSEQILIYGESLGGAIALNLAVKHPEAGGLIMQSSFTSMAETVKRSNFFRFFPISLILTEEFDSLSKIRALQIPVLFLHGTADSVVPPDMSQRLYDAAPEPKQLFLISGAEHVRIYQPGDQSYLRAIYKFVKAQF